MAEMKVIEQRQDGIDIIEMKNQDLTVRVTNLGCHILSVWMKDNKGNIDDVVLGLQNIEDYKEDDKYIGGILGRAANRIKDGMFTLNGQEYHQPISAAFKSLEARITTLSTPISKSVPISFSLESSASK